MAGLSRGERATGLVALIALIGVVLWGLDVGSGSFLDIPSHDTNEDWDWQLVLAEVGRQQVLAGQFPAWNAYLEEPLWANPEFGGMYPGFVLVLLFGAAAGTKLLLAFHLALAAVGGWMAGRQLGISPALANLGATALLFTVMLPGFVGWGHVMFAAIGWLPLAWVAQRRGRWGWAGLCLAMPALAGGHYLALYGVLWLALDGVFRSLDGRAKWLAPGLLIAALPLPGIWPVALIALVCGVVVQRRPSLGPLKTALGTLAVAALLSAPKWLPVLFIASDRLGQGMISVANPWVLGDWYAVIAGWVDRPSGHEGPNVYGWAAPVVLAGLGWAAWWRPQWGLIGLVFWNLSWSGSTALNLAEGLHLLPGFDSIRVVERYGLVAALFAGWSVAAMVDRPVVRWVGVAAWVAWASVQLPVLTSMRTGPAGWEAPERGAFVMRESGEGSCFHSVLKGEGRRDCRSALDIEEPQDEGPVRGLIPGLGLAGLGLGVLVVGRRRKELRALSFPPSEANGS